MKTLFQFAKENCANIDGTECVMNGSKCLLAKGKPCTYFKESVWPDCDPNYRYASQSKYYPALRDEFTQVFGRVQTHEVRRCGCGEPLKKRERICEKCRKKNRRKTWRVQKQKQAG
jgi:hypothetical protein